MVWSGSVCIVILIIILRARIGLCLLPLLPCSSCSACSLVLLSRCFCRSGCFVRLSLSLSLSLSLLCSVCLVLVLLSLYHIGWLLVVLLLCLVRLVLLFLAAVLVWLLVLALGMSRLWFLASLVLVLLCLVLCAWLMWFSLFLPLLGLVSGFVLLPRSACSCWYHVCRFLLYFSCSGSCCVSRTLSLLARGSAGVAVLVLWLCFTRCYRNTDNHQ